MLKITLLTVGNLKEPYWKDAQDEYLRRLRPFSKIEVIEVPAEPFGGTVTAAQSMAAEGEKLLKRIPDNSVTFALERTGKSFDSPAFALMMQERGGTGAHLVFVIGGATGLSPAVLERSQQKLSMSAMTITHEMARVFLLEQIYRATTIITGKSYHL